MAKYEFAGSLFRNEHEMLDAIAAQWVSADGWNGAAEPREILHRLTDDLLASRCIDGWGLSRSPIGRRGPPLTHGRERLHHRRSCAGVRSPSGHHSP